MRREALSHPVAAIGVVLTTVSAVVFIALVIAMLAGLFENPYAGLVVFVLIPLFFVVGLLLIPLGVRLWRRRLLREPGASADWPVLDFRRPSVRRNALVIAALTGVNAVIILLAGYGSLHWMESPSFCGQVCHTPMHPQFTAWSNGMHARIACVECHIGNERGDLIHAKLNGLRQLFHVVTNSYPRPIPPEVKMPGGSQAKTCLGCHQPGHVAGDQIRVIREYADDNENTETMTILQMHVGRASSAGRSIHWHADPAIRVEYVATDNTEQNIPYVRVTDEKNQVREYISTDANPQEFSGIPRRTMDCIDCHNRVGHPIAQSPERAVDDAIAAGRLSRQLPHVRGEAVRLLKAHTDDPDRAAPIAGELKAFYQPHEDAADPQMLARAVTAVQALYQGNVFPAMKVTWGSYPDNKGHTTSNGCFRCHDDSHKAKDGSAISADCEYCHKQIEKPSN